MTTRNTARHSWTAAAGCGLLLLTARCDCGGALVDGDAGMRTDAQVDAAILDLAALDAGVADHATSDLAGADVLAPDGAGADVRPVDGNTIDGNTNDAGAVEAGLRDHGDGDAATSDATTADTGAVGDGGAGDASAADAAQTLVDASTDLGLAADATTQVDAASADAGAPDATAVHDSGSTTGLSAPCQNGPGWTLFRFHYDGSYSARLDVWDATCDYSLAPGSACNVVPVRTETLVHDDSALLISSTAYIRVRFDVNGLNFSRAAVYVQARSYSTSASTGIEVWSPLYGSVLGGPVDNDWVFDWYGMDWTGYLSPDDDPDLTAIQIYAYQGSGSLAVHAVELCVE